MFTERLPVLIQLVPQQLKGLLLTDTISIGNIGAELGGDNILSRICLHHAICYIHHILLTGVPGQGVRAFDLIVRREVSNVLPVNTPSVDIGFKPGGARIVDGGAVLVRTNLGIDVQLDLSMTVSTAPRLLSTLQLITEHPRATTVVVVVLHVELAVIVHLAMHPYPLPSIVAELIETALHYLPGTLIRIGVDSLSHLCQSFGDVHIVSGEPDAMESALTSIPSLRGQVDHARDGYLLLLFDNCAIRRVDEIPCTVIRPGIAVDSASIDVPDQSNGEVPGKRSHDSHDVFFCDHIAQTLVTVMADVDSVRRHHGLGL